MVQLDLGVHQGCEAAEQCGAHSIAENEANRNGGSLPADAEGAWHSDSLACGHLSCCFNLVGRRDRAIENREVCDAVAAQLEQDQRDQMIESGLLRIYS